MSEQRIYTCDVPDCGELATERLISQGLLSDGGVELAPFALGDFCGAHWLLVHPNLIDGHRGWAIADE